MRISGGQFRGRKISSKKSFAGKKGGEELRPTSAKVREALFDILQSEIRDARFLDLYAGTGAVGIEAVSRGASAAVLVESDPVRAKAISHYIKETLIADRARVFSEPALSFLRRAGASRTTFHIIFADPPYESPEIPEVISIVNDEGLLVEGGCFVLEHSSRKRFEDDYSKVKRMKTYKYGDTMLTLFRRTE